MAVTYVRIPASLAMRSEMNVLSPGRVKTQDGWIGDTAHQGKASDHNPDETGNTGSSPTAHDADGINEVHADDYDSRGPWPSWVDHGTGKTMYADMEWIVQFLLREIRAGRERRFRYIIYRRRIWEASNSWKQRVYTGADPHVEHAHFSYTYGSGLAPKNPEQVTTPYGFMAAYKALAAAPKPPAREDDMPTAKDVAKEVILELVQTPKTISDQQRGDITTRSAKATADLLAPIFNELLNLARGEAKEVPPTVDQISAAVLAKLSTLPSNADKAALLVSLLGVDAADVARRIAELTGTAPAPAS